MASSCSVCSATCRLTCCCRKRFYCSKVCQEADWEQHRANCPKVEEKEISEEKGRGLVATRNIKKGSIVLEEDPLMLIKKGKDLEARVLEAHKKLTKHDKIKFGSLHALNRPERKKVLNIWSANSLSTQVMKSDEPLLGVYYRTALINHSCGPNSVINFTENRRIKIVAVEQIKAGEEVLLNYLRPTVEQLLKYQRQKMLRTRFQFNCECRVCSLSGQELEVNQRLKKELSGIDASLHRYRDIQKVVNVQSSLAIQLEITKYMKKLGTEMIRDYYRSIHSCYFFVKILDLHQVRTTESAQTLRMSAKKEAETLGESFLRSFEERDKEYDAVINKVVQHLLVKRKKKVVVYYLNKH